MPRVTYRKFQAGDEEAINELYFSVTRCKRTIEQFRWQWLSAPAGQGEIWLIEYEEDNGKKTLIGHHGLMPLYFSNGEQDLVVGKTENTMVLPNYRRKMLYPKLERKFLESYKHRFDLLFSTKGPAPAIRQRKAMGYDAKERWVSYSWKLGLGGTLSRLLYSISVKQNKNIKLRSLEKLLEISVVLLKPFNIFRRIPKTTFSMEVLEDHQAKEHPFFDDFWEKCRYRYGVTPRRYREDLKWRYWENPNCEYITILINAEENCTAYAILRRRFKTTYTIDDFISQNSDLNFQKEIIENLCAWVSSKKGMVLDFTTTSDDKKFISALDSVKYDNIMKKFPYSKIKKDPQLMPRKACIERGNVDESYLTGWYVTPFYFEGR